MKPIQFRLTLALALLALWLGPPRDLAAVTSTWKGLLNYQGQLTDAAGNAVADNTYAGVTFKIYNVASGGAALWTETQPITTSKGLFNVVLGSVTPLTTLPVSNFTTDLWISITVPPDVTEMLPRQQLLPSAGSINSHALQGLFPNNTANNIPVLDASGQIPASMIAGGSLTVPMNLNGSGGAYNLNVNNTSGAGIISTGSTSNTGIWGQSPAGDTSSSIGVRGSSTNGTGMVAESTNSNGLSATSAGAANYAIYASGTNAVKLVSKASGIGIQATTVAGGQTVNVLDGVSNAGFYASVVNANMFGVSATSAGSTAVYGRTNSGSATDYGVWGDNSAAGGVGVYGTGNKGVYGSGTAYGVYANGGTYGLYANGTSYGVYANTNGTYAIYANNTIGGYGLFATVGNGGIGVNAQGTFGVQGTAIYAGGRGVSGLGNGFGYGVYATSNSAAYSGTYTDNSAANGTALTALHTASGAGSNGIGVQAGSAGGVGARGVYSAVSGSGGSLAIQGFASLGATGGTAVRGDALGANSTGGYFTGAGTAVVASGTTGVNAFSNSPSGVAGIFQNNAGVGLQVSGTTVGASVTSTAVNGYGVLARSSGGGSYAVYGENTDSGGGAGTNYGVYGKANNGTNSFGVYGDGQTGVYGSGTQYGVNAIGGTYGLNASGSSYGVYAYSANGNGLYSQTNGSTYNTILYNSYSSGSGLTGAGLLVESHGTPIWAYMDSGGNGDGILMNYYGTTGNGINVQYTGSSGSAGLFSSSGSSGVKNGVWATEASTNAATAAGRFDHTAGSGSVYGVWGTTASPNGIAGRFDALPGSGPSAGVYASNPSASDGASAGHFYQSGNAATLYGNSAVFAETNQANTAALYALNSSNGASTAIVASGNYYGLSVTARAGNIAVVAHSYYAFQGKCQLGGTNFRSETNDDPTYGFYHSNSTPNGTSYGTYVYNYGTSAIGGYYSNTSATTGSGAALQVYGRMNYPSASGTVSIGVGSSSGTIVNSFIRSSANTSIVLTPLTDPQGRYYVTNIGTTAGQATVQLTSVVAGSTVTFQYMIFGK